MNRTAPTAPARSTDPVDYQRVPRPVAAMAKDFTDGHHIAPHSHERAQLLFAVDGVMLVSTSAGSWAVPPQRAVWVPAGVTHEIRMAGAVAMRTIYVRTDTAARRICAVSPNSSSFGNFVVSLYTRNVRA